MKISELKKDAKLKLTGKWGLAIGINLIYLLITSAFSIISTKFGKTAESILSLVIAIISIPLAYGLSMSMLKLSRNEIVGLVDFITDGLKVFKRAFFLSLSILARILIPIILICVGITLSIFAAISSEANTALLGISLLLVLASMIYLLYKALAYALTIYLLIDNPEANSKEVISKSCELMKGNKLKYIGLFLSFIGWFLLCGIISGLASIISTILGAILTLITSLVLTPYLTFAEINFYEDLAGISDVTTVIPEVEKTEEEEN